MSAVVSRLRAHATDLWMAGAIVALDQVTKPLVRAMVPTYESITIVPGLLNFTHVQNTGAAFGILNLTDFPYKTPILITVHVIALLSIGLYAVSLPVHQRLVRTGLSFILGGAVGNLIDRVRHGYVLDFVDVYWRQYHFWAFNVADAAITIGVAMIILDLLITRGPARIEGAPHPQ
ncbi:MAG: signal peptidase II [Vicinamibacterales bacterium]